MDTLQELEATFRLFDSNGDGKIDFSEFVEMSKALGQTLSDTQALSDFSAMDIDGDGSVNLDEFARWWTHSVEVTEIDYGEDD